MTIIGGLVYKKSMIFMVFGVYLSELLIFLHEIFFVSKLLPILVIINKILIMGPLVTLGTRLKVIMSFLTWIDSAKEILGGNGKS